MDFTTAKFNLFTFNSIGIRLCEKYGLSKGKSLEAFCNEAQQEDVFKLLSDLMDYYVGYGEGLNVRDWRYVKDHCLGILAVLEKGKVGEVYNLGGHNEKANIEIVKIILKELGKPESLITYVADRKGHDQRYAIDPSKAMKELGWAPTTMFADGIKLTIKWYQEHMDWMAECTSGEYMKYYEEMYANR